ncbi:MAG: malonyl CoA-ACP transacylase, partial [Paenibacillaceae bacterium]|nr:malonyl CoA-ACP transacylase [Paenibacillaceae bacterium]
GAKRVIPLEVSGPFHSSLMKPAAEQLGEALAKVQLAEARIPVVANVTARPVASPEQIRQLLVEQVYSPVRWEESVTWLIEQGVDRFVEIGSGTVLAGLIRKIDRSVTVVSLNSLESIRNYSA